MTFKGFFQPKVFHDSMILAVVFLFAVRCLFDRSLLIFLIPMLQFITREMVCYFSVVFYFFIINQLSEMETAVRYIGFVGVYFQLGSNSSFFHIH